MPGRPHRHKILDDIPLNPSWYRAMNVDERRALLFANNLGLLGRLKRIAPHEARAALAGMRLARRFFPHLVRLNGIKKASSAMRKIIASWTIKQIEAFSKNSLDLNPVTLFIESCLLVRNMPSRDTLPARQAWLRKQKIPERLIRDSAQQSDADLAELILAERHGTNQGKIHKLLAIASRLMKPEPTTKATSQ